MTKSFINTLIRNMKKAGIITKNTPWMMDEKFNQKAESLYVGIKLDQDWQSIISEKNNLMLKFTVNKNLGLLEFYLANKPPFILICSQKLETNIKWEYLLGEFKRQLRKDKEECINHHDKVANLYKLIAPNLIS